MLNAKWMDKYPTGQELCDKAETRLAPAWPTTAFKWDEPIGGFIGSAPLPDGWSVSIKIDTEDIGVVNPTCSRTLTTKEYLDARA